MNRLRVWRDTSNLTQAQAAEQIGLNTVVYSQVESGRLVPTERIAALLAAFFDEPADKLLEEVRVRKLPSPVQSCARNG